MVILHTEICKKIDKLEKNYLHLYLTIFLNNFLMISSERLAEYEAFAVGQQNAKAKIGKTDQLKKAISQ